MWKAYTICTCNCYKTKIEWKIKSLIIRRRKNHGILWYTFSIVIPNKFLLNAIYRYIVTPLVFLCRLRSIAAHRDHFVRPLSVSLSVCLSGSHTFLVVMHSYVLQATYAFLGMLPLCSSSLSVVIFVLFILCHNCSSIMIDRHFIFSILTLLMEPFQMTSRSMIMWSLPWLSC